MAAAAFEHIPIVDVGGLTNGDRPSPELAEELCSVGHEVGFMLVVGHGVPERLHDATYDMMRRFFSLPVEQKRLIDKRASRHFRGWEPVGTEYTNNRPDIREQIDCWSEWPASAPDAEPEYLRLLGPNQWLPDDVLAGHEALSNEWSGQLGVLAGRLLAAMWQGLGLPAADLERFIGDRPMSVASYRWCNSGAGVGSFSKLPTHEGDPRPCLHEYRPQKPSALRLMSCSPRAGTSLRSWRR